METKTELNEYEQQAQNFLKTVGGTVETKFKKKGYHFLDDKKNCEERNIYDVTIKTKYGKMAVEFGDSINNTEKEVKELPRDYEVLSCLTKDDVGTFDDFCSEFGYDDLPLSNYSRVKKIYLACLKEFDDIKIILNNNEEHIELLREVQ